MDPDDRRRAALILTIGFLFALTGFMTWGVLHKIHKKLIVEPNGPEVVDIMAVPATKVK